MKNQKKQLTTILVLMIVLGSFIFSRVELKDFLEVEIPLLIIFGVLLGLFLTLLRKRNS